MTGSAASICIAARERYIQPSERIPMQAFNSSENEIAEEEEKEKHYWKQAE